jgi:hypothetical protein
MVSETCPIPGRSGAPQRARRLGLVDSGLLSWFEPAQPDDVGGPTSAELVRAMWSTGHAT